MAEDHLPRDLTAEEPASRTGNPYIGPTSFSEKDTLYGRDSELAQLTDRLIAERIVLLHSPSGAGKTSLVRASLIPAMRAEGFRVHPVIRVNLEPPPGGASPNRYIYSTLASLEDAYPDDPLSPDTLASLSLDAYLDRRAEALPKTTLDLLVFDQFEEVLVVDPADRAAKQVFFSQLGAALRNRSRWALFAMREDFLGGLEPYVRQVPTFFENTFRLDLLEPPAALEAIQRPARAVGVDFIDEAARKLVDDLRRVLVQRPDSTLEYAPGPYVEPVQLQLACYRLWERRDPHDPDISITDLAEVGDVDQSLAEYYDQTVKAVSSDLQLDERELRRWFEDRLITREGIRAPVLMGAVTSGDMDTRAVRRLEQAHLVRGEKRAGAIWFELAHDRLIGPVKSANAQWFGANLNVLERFAALWDASGRPERLLITGDELKAAEVIAAKINLPKAGQAGAQSGMQSQLHRRKKIEDEFLEACRLAERRLRRERLFRFLIIALAVGAFLALAAAGYAWNSAIRAQNQADTAQRVAVTAQAEAVDQRAEAEVANELAVAQRATAEAAREQTLYLAATAQVASDEALHQYTRARSLDLAAQAQSLLSAPAPNAETAALLAIQSLKIRENEQARTVLDASLPMLFGEKILGSGLGEISSVAFSPDGSMAAAASLDGLIVAWDVASGDLLYELKDETVPTSVRFSPDGRWLLWAGYNGFVRLSDARTGETVRNFAAEGTIYMAIFSPDGKYIAAAGQGYVNLWEAESGAYITTYQGITDDLPYQGDFYAVTFFDIENGFLNLAAGGEDETAFVWTVPLEGEEYEQLFYEVIGNPVHSLAYDSDYKMLFAAQETNFLSYVSNQIIPYDHPHNGSHAGPITSLVIMPGDWASWLTTSQDGTARIWSKDTGHFYRIFSGHSGAVTSADYSPDRQKALTGSSDGSVRLWNADLTRTVNLWKGYSISYDAPLVFNNAPDDHRLYFGLEEALVAIDPLDARLFNIYPLDLRNITQVAFSPDGKQAAVVGTPRNTITLIDLEMSEIIAASVDRFWDISGLAFTPDGKRLVATSNDRRLVVLDAGDADVIRTFSTQGKPDGLALDPVSGRVFMTESGCLTEANLESGQLDLFYCNPTYVLLNLAISPDGTRILAGDEQGAAHLIDIETGQEIEYYWEHEQAITSVAFSPDGRYLLTSSRDNTARLWDAEIGVTLHIFSGHTAAISKAVFSPDGQRIATLSEDGSVRLWGVETQGVIDQACGLLLRDLSDAERDRYDISPDEQTCE